MERPIRLEIRRFVDELVLTSLIGIDHLHISRNLLVAWIQEKSAAALGYQFGERSTSSGGASRIPLVCKDVNRRPSALTHVDDVVESSMAGVVDSVSEEQDEVAGNSPGFNLPSIAASLVKRIKDGGSRIPSSLKPGNRAYAQCYVFRFISPVLSQLCLGIKTHDKRSVDPLSKQLSGIEVRDGRVVIQFFEHGFAGIK